MDRTLIVDNVTQLRALAVPLRQRILAAFCSAPATTKQIALQLGEKPTRLYHHVNLLEKAGLLVLVETRRNRGTVEKYFQTAAQQFVVDHQLLRAASESGEATGEAQSSAVNMLQSALNDARDHFHGQLVQQSGAARTMLLGQAHLQLSSSQAQDLIEKMSTWLETCCDVKESQDASPYLFNIVLFPLQVGNRSERNYNHAPART